MNGKDRVCRYNDGDSEELSLEEVRILPRCADENCPIAAPPKKIAGDNILLAGANPPGEFNMPIDRKGDETGSDGIMDFSILDIDETQVDVRKTHTVSPSKCADGASVESKGAIDQLFDEASGNDGRDGRNLQSSSSNKESEDGKVLPNKHKRTASGSATQDGNASCNSSDNEGQMDAKASLKDGPEDKIIGLTVTNSENSSTVDSTDSSFENEDCSHTPSTGKADQTNDSKTSQKDDDTEEDIFGTSDDDSHSSSVISAHPKNDKGSDDDENLFGPSDEEEEDNKSNGCAQLKSDKCSDDDEDLFGPSSSEEEEDLFADEAAGDKEDHHSSGEEEEEDEDLFASSGEDSDEEAGDQSNKEFSYLSTLSPPNGDEDGDNSRFLKQVLIEPLVVLQTALV